MKSLRFFLPANVSALLSLVSVLAVLSFAPGALAVPPVTPKLALENGYVYAPLSGSNATAGYGTLVNVSKTTVEILSATSNAFQAIEIHETKEENGLMKMKKVPSLTLKPGERFELKPGGNHLMLFDAKTPLKPGDHLKLVFQLADENKKPTVASSVDVPVKARAQ